jgi:hypothetical protein
MSGGEPLWRDIESLPGSGETFEWMTAVHKDLLAWWRRNHQSQ